MQQDRKFFLPITRHVLRESIRRNTECSMHNTGMGFVAIHQFANNLWSKAWRPEYRTIKVRAQQSHIRGTPTHTHTYLNLGSLSPRRRTPASTSRRSTAIWPTPS